MHPDRRQLAEQLYAESHAHDLATEDRLERFRNIEPESAALLGVAIRASGATRLLELGTSNGYSTLWLGDGAEANHGTLLTVDIDPARTAQATVHVERAGLGDTVELRIDDAASVLAAAGDASYDFILLDAERPHYPDYLADLIRVLRPGGLLVVDNVISHADQLTAFTAAIEALPALTQTVVPVGAGMRFVVTDRSRPAGNV